MRDFRVKHGWETCLPKRVEAMHTVRGRGTKLKYRSHPKAFGSPDFLVEGRLYLFCDGSFWHGRDWKELKQRLEGKCSPHLAAF